MRKTIFIIRHADAETGSNSGMFKDVERDLTTRGIMQAAKVGRFLADDIISINHYISSPANRAYQTAKVILEQMNMEIDVLEKSESLYGGGARGYLSTLNSISEKHNSVAIFGHNPDITFFAEYLTRDDVLGNMNKASFIELSFDDLTWAEISGNTGTMVRRVDVKNIDSNAE